MICFDWLTIIFPYWKSDYIFDNIELIAILYRLNLCFYRIQTIICSLIYVYVKNIVFTLKITLCLYKIAISYISSPFFMLFLISIKSFNFFCFPIYNIAKAIKEVSVNEIRDFVFGNYYKRIGIFKENSYYFMRRLKNRKICCCLQSK